MAGDHMSWCGLGNEFDAMTHDEYRLYGSDQGNTLKSRLTGSAYTRVDTGFGGKGESLFFGEWNLF